MTVDRSSAEAVDAVIVDERDRDWVLRHLRPLVGMDARLRRGESGQVEAFAAWRRFFEALAEDAPTVLVFEDIHWADDALLDFIDLLADRAGAVPLLIVCTARPELFERREHWGGGKGNAHHDLADTVVWRGHGAVCRWSCLSRRAPGRGEPAFLERAEGNPLYAQEYVRMLQDRGLLVTTAWLAVDGRGRGLPESIHGIIAARLDTLNADERAFVHDAAVIGRTAWVGAVCALTERSPWKADELLHRSGAQTVAAARLGAHRSSGETEFSSLTP